MDNLIEILLLGLLIGALILASLWDIRTREIPDYLPAGMIIIGLFVQLVWAFLTGAWDIFVSTLITTCIYFLVATVLFLAGYWGGGDTKLLVGIGALYGNLSSPIFPLIPPTPVAWSHSISLFLNIILINAIYSVLYTLGCSLMNPEAKSAIKKAIKFNQKELLLTIISSGIIAILLYFLQMHLILYLIVPCIIAFLITLFKVIRTIETQYFWKSVHTSKITEGDLLKDPILTPEGKKMGNSHLGLTKDEINQIRNMANSKIIPHELAIRWGPPGAPSFLISVLSTMIFGDLVSHVIRLLITI